MELKEELKEKIIKANNLEEMKPSDIADDEPLFDENGVGLDSIDALEIIVFLEKDYGIRIKDPRKGKEVFKNINTLADFVAKNRTK